jgi:2-polyprenyl-6-methoxyphenol hydroxylase-like FAD-dependent oxidoreductase
MALRVLIAGGGIGGLCLAQGLRKAGVETQVFERDASAVVRGQGFRFRVDADGDAALAACLPTNLYALYRATSSRPVEPPAAAYDSQMQEVFRMPPRAAGAAQHMSVNRRTLREALMGGLDGSIQFGHALTRVEQSGDNVTAFFANGATAVGDVLVAADGIGSVVRRQMLPDAEPLDTGMRCIYGTTPLDRNLLEALPEIFSTGFVPFAGPEGRTLAMGMFRARRPMMQAAMGLAPDVRLTPVRDYMMWLCVAPRDAFAMTEKDLRAADCAALHRKALELTEGWHESLRLVLKRAEVATLFQLAIRTSLPVAAWPTTRVTLLGDAIHAMTPAGGIGANTAMRDGALLAKLLGEAARGERDWLSAIAQYEAEMRSYGFAAARQSLEAAARLYRIPMPVKEVA